MKKVKLEESVIVKQYITNHNKHTFNIDISGDINTGYVMPCLVILFDTVGHNAIAFMSKTYSHLLYSKIEGTFAIGEMTNATLGSLYLDTQNYIHIKNNSETRAIKGSYRVIEL